MGEFEFEVKRFRGERWITDTLFFVLLRDAEPTRATLTTLLFGCFVIFCIFERTAAEEEEEEEGEGEVQREGEAQRVGEVDEGERGRRDERVRRPADPERGRFVRGVLLTSEVVLSSMPE